MPPLTAPVRPIRRLPAYALNGIEVAIGIATVQIVFTALAGPLAAQLASSAAVCTSLADVPTTARRTWQRVLAAALLSIGAALVVALLKPWPIALGFGVAAVAFVAMMMLSWGIRAGAVSFAPILSMVFAMVLPPGTHLGQQLLWNALGALAFVGWSVAATALLQPRYRRLALVDALRATARLFRSRAGVLTAPRTDGDDSDDSSAMRTWIVDEAALAERMQSARDLLFAAPDDAPSRRDTAILLHAIDLRDVLLASRLDLDLLGDDEIGRRLVQRVAGALQQIAGAIDSAADALTQGQGAPVAAALPDPQQVFADLHAEVADARSRLLPAIESRLSHLTRNVGRIHALLQGDDEALPLTREQLRLFVAPEGWPLRALRAQFSLSSPVLRHAVRTGLALSSAYFLALALPWASHPHWLVLSVAVVLRGNLEQTLTRRNARVLGTVLGCLLVVGLAQLPSLQHLSFLVAVGVAHSFVNVRYLVTATAATVMALLQSHLVDPAGGFAIGERLADTLLGAALAWAFSYVLPSWERRSLPQAIGRALLALQDYAARALTPDAGAAIEQRLARRKAYDALGTLATAVQRSAYEPERVRVPVRELSGFIDHAQRLMAHLSVIRMMLVRRSAELDRAQADAALQSASARLATHLDPKQRAEDGAAPVLTALGLESLPAEPPLNDPTPWLLRRLQVTVHDARQARQAARAVVARLGREKP